MDIVEEIGERDWLAHHMGGRGAFLGLAIVFVIGLSNKNR